MEARREPLHGLPAQYLEGTVKAVLAIHDVHLPSTLAAGGRPASAAARRGRALKRFAAAPALLLRPRDVAPAGLRAGLPGGAWRGGATVVRGASGVEERLPDEESAQPLREKYSVGVHLRDPIVVRVLLGGPDRGPDLHEDVGDQSDVPLPAVWRGKVSGDPLRGHGAGGVEVQGEVAVQNEAVASEDSRLARVLLASQRHLPDLRLDQHPAEQRGQAKVGRRRAPVVGRRRRRHVPDRHVRKPWRKRRSRRGRCGAAPCLRARRHLEVRRSLL
mmetsp:Transcript_57002/g.159970  ORF Transcript_57002/g.159970 Transcript_57002/m.159970 type:complete len:274 (+) Transcript_57002:345-1166(+)